LKSDNFVKIHMTKKRKQEIAFMLKLHNIQGGPINRTDFES